MDINSLKGFTPGPWNEEEGWVHSHNAAAPICDPRMMDAQLHMHEMDANAALIAAAPDLLELARMGLELGEFYLQGGTQCKSIGEFNQRMAEKANALREKAGQL